MSRTILEYIHEAHETAVEKGWWDGVDRNFGEQVALMHTELSEAFEEYRKFGMHPAAMLYTDVELIGGTQLFTNEPGEKPEGIAAEFADVLIRIFDTCGRYGIPLTAALDAKLAFNKTRPHRHGGKFA